MAATARPAEPPYAAAVLPFRAPAAEPMGRYAPPSLRTRLFSLVMAVLIPLGVMALLLLRFHYAAPVQTPPAPLVVSLLPAASPPQPVRDRKPGPLQVARAPSKPQPRPEPIPPVPLLVNPVPVRVNLPTPPAAEAGRPAPTTSAPVSEPAPPAPQAAGRDTSFEARLLRHIQKFRRYPPVSKRMGEQGVTHLRIRMDRAGRLLSAEVMRSSGSKSLDRGALDTIRRAAPLPEIPADRPDTLELVIPVEFFIE